MTAKLCLLAVASLIVSSGCGSGHPKTYAVSGQVTVGGKPLTTGEIQLVPETGRPAVGTIGSDGRFELGTFDERDGAPKGTYKVVVLATEKAGGQIRTLVPDRFSSSQASDKSVTIDGATSALQIDLTWAPGEKPWSRPFREDKLAPYGGDPGPK
jgi:hypothetical protein